MRNFFVFLLLFTSLAVSAAKVDPEKKWGALITAIAQVESEGRADVVSKCGRYVGYLQISKILVRQCNQIVGYNKYTYSDRLNKEKSKQMFIDYQEYFNPEGNMEKAIRLWNSGDLNCMKRKASTDGYYKKVMRKYSEMAEK
ncbi:MAG: transglycosylase SLT domain-containing protein [Roseburia sp.]|nr:transglycosylase SLT domain-containing protein [Roseburia sp.]MCM1420065.1 transglycosylase SLT domain-containing protein [Bacteroides sp.]